MKQHQESQENSHSILKKKIYKKPVLTVLGKISELTTGGSVNVQETGKGRHGANPNGRT